MTINPYPDAAAAAIAIVAEHDFHVPDVARLDQLGMVGTPQTWPQR